MVSWKSLTICEASPVAVPVVASFLGVKVLAQVNRLFHFNLRVHLGRGMGADVGGGHAPSSTVLAKQQYISNSARFTHARRQQVLDYGVNSPGWVRFTPSN